VKHRSGHSHDKPSQPAVVSQSRYYAASRPQTRNVSPENSGSDGYRMPDRRESFNPSINSDQRPVKSSEEIQ
jgi:hypothetical protein